MYGFILPVRAVPSSLKDGGDDDDDDGEGEDWHCATAALLQYGTNCCNRGRA